MKFHEVASLFNLPHSIGFEEVDNDSFIHNTVINNAFISDIMAAFKPESLSK